MLIKTVLRLEENHARAMSVNSNSALSLFRPISLQSKRMLNSILDSSFRVVQPATVAHIAKSGE